MDGDFDKFFSYLLVSGTKSCLERDVLRNLKKSIKLEYTNVWNENQINNSSFRRRSMNGPKYKHDCDKCIFLGSYSSNDMDHDLYYCSQKGFPTVISRHGDEGEKYTSGIELAKTNTLPSLAEALKRAIEKGYHK
jgi:hypothetical protein